MRNYYDVLGVPHDASEDAIKRAFQQRAKILHPDVNKSSTATVEFQELNKAFETLKDSFKRQDHDHAILKAASRDAPEDIFDSVIGKKKKKKKKKKKVESTAQAEPQRMPVPQPYVAPQYIYVVPQAPPQQQQHPYYDPNQRHGQADWDAIPPGYAADDGMGIF